MRGRDVPFGAGEAEAVGQFLLQGGPKLLALLVGHNSQLIVVLLKVDIVLLNFLPVAARAAAMTTAVSTAATASTLKSGEHGVLKMAGDATYASASTLAHVDAECAKWVEWLWCELADWLSKLSHYFFGLDLCRCHGWAGRRRSKVGPGRARVLAKHPTRRHLWLLIFVPGITRLD